MSTQSKNKTRPTSLDRGGQDSKLIAGIGHREFGQQQLQHAHQYLLVQREIARVHSLKAVITLLVHLTGSVLASQVAFSNSPNESL